MAQLRGYKANIEEPLTDGSGMVDVSLERNGKRIACEISITTKPSWELHNIEKCLKNGFHVVVVCSTEIKVLEKIKELVLESIDKLHLEQIFFMNPEQLFFYIDEEIAKEASTEVRTKGYKVQVNYSPISEEELKRKKDAVSKSIFGSPKKKQDL